VDSAFVQMGTSGYRWYDENSLKQSFDALGNSDNRAWTFGRGEHHGNFGSRLSLGAGDAQAISSAYRTIRDGHGGRWGDGLSLNEWVWSDSYRYDSQGNRLSVTNGWGTVTSDYFTGPGIALAVVAILTTAAPASDAHVANL